MQFIPYKINPQDNRVTHFVDDHTHQLIVFHSEYECQDFLLDQVKKFIIRKEGEEKAETSVYTRQTLPVLKQIPDGYYAISEFNDCTVSLFKKITGWLSTSNDCVELYRYEKIKTDLTKRTRRSNPLAMQFGGVVDEIKNFKLEELKKIELETKSDSDDKVENKPPRVVLRERIESDQPDDIVNEKMGDNTVKPEGDVNIEQILKEFEDEFGDSTPQSPPPVPPKPKRLSVSYSKPVYQWDNDNDEEIEFSSNVDVLEYDCDGSENGWGEMDIDWSNYVSDDENK